MKRIKRSINDNGERQWDDSESSLQDSYSFNISKISEGVAGKIESLQMTNFMCHSNLEVKFNPRVNFITGNNGSGKSAIMAAFIIVLGGPASLTGRGSSVADFIKKGENWAKVSITLINEGSNTFKKEIYGSKITIIRNLSRASGNSYLCKSECGRVVSKKKEEVDNIVLAFNLQIKNPICVLNQDVARSFLCTSDNSLRFNMFMKATQLEELKTLYMMALELLVASKKELQKKEKSIEEASKEMAQLKEKLELFASLEKHVHERTGLENEFLWSLVSDEEKKLKLLKEREIQLDDKKGKMFRQEENFENVVKGLEEEVKKCQNKMQEMKSVIGDAVKEKNGVLQEIRNFERQLEKAEGQLKLLISKKERKVAEIDGVKEYMKQKDEINSQSQAEKTRAEEKMSKLKEHLSSIRDEMGNLQRELNGGQEIKFQHSRAVENSKADLGELEQNKKRLEILLAGTKAKTHNNVLKFGPYTQDILEAIEEAFKRNQFKKKPVGPCGMYVNLVGDPKWARAVEFVIGDLMTAYCCDNQEDCQVLHRIMDRVCGGSKQPPIIISKFLRHRHDIQSRKVSHRGLPSVVDVLKFSHDVAFNTFVDQARIETILLFETDSQAASALTNIQNVPKNLKMGITLQSDQYYPAPNYRTYYGDPKRRLRYFEGLAKGSDGIKKLELELKEVCKELQEKSAEIIKSKQDYLGVCRNLEENENKIKQLKQKEKKLQLELNQLKDIEESRPVSKTTVVLEEELQTLEEALRELSGKTNEVQELVDGLNNKKTDCMKKLNEIALKENALEKKYGEVEEKLEEKKFEHRKLLKEREGTNNQLIEINKKLEEVEKEVRKSKSQLNEKIKAAEEVCPERIETERSPVEVQKLLEKCEKYLKTAEKMAGSREATITEYKEKLEIFKTMKKMATLLTKSIETLKRAAFNREQKLDIHQSHTANIVSFYFQAVLQTRGYDGQLKIDFNNNVLDIEVKPKDASVARKDAKTLSGGERSYSTVSFILAIWKVVSMPIYFMDEFDVFMDKINRKVIMDLLLEHATVQSNEQFVFITPQDISSIQTSDVISVYKLPDPERKLC